MLVKADNDVEGGCEARLAGMVGRKAALLAPRATIALVALLRALGLPVGSEVLMPAMLCANPAYAVRWAGLRPVFGDVLPGDFNLDLDAAERVVGPQTRVLLAVPIFGHPLDLPALLDFAEGHKLMVVEDGAHAVGLRYGDVPAGSVGVCSIFSFGRGKIADAGGGAAILSDDRALLRRAQLILQEMPSGKVPMAGQAAAIMQALDLLPRELVERCAAADEWRREVAMPGVEQPRVAMGLPLWKYSVLLPGRRERDALTRGLLARGVCATNLYPPLPHFFKEARRSEAENYPVAWELFGRIVNLPLTSVGQFSNKCSE